MLVEYDDAAIEEALAAAGYYEGRSEGLAREFLVAWKEAESRVSNAPTQYPSIYKNFRRCLFQRFPYSLIYRDSENRIEIVAVMHQHREPGYWRSRVEVD